MEEHIDKSKVADSFLSSIETYEQNSQVQSLVAEKLLNICKSYIPNTPQKVLEVGCGAGLFTRKLVSEFKIENLVLSDLSKDICNYTKSQLSAEPINIEILVGDIEKLELPCNCDLIISSSSLQWLDEINSFFMGCSKSLKDSGSLVFSMFGAGTMYEIRKLTGNGLRYYSKVELHKILQQYYQIEFIEENHNILFFETVKDIVKHIRNTGVGGLNQSPLSVGQFKQFANDYKSFATNEGLPVSYNSLFVVAKKK